MKHRIVILAFFLLLATGRAQAGTVPGAPGGTGDAAKDGQGPDIRPPSPLEQEPPEKGFGRIRLSAWLGWTNAAARKDTLEFDGDRLSWEDDLNGSPLFAWPSIYAELKVHRKVYAFLGFSWISQWGTGRTPGSGIRFDGETFAEDRRLSVSMGRLLLDLGFMAWGKVTETYRIGFALGTRYQSIWLDLSSSDGTSARETTEAFLPFVEARTEITLSKSIFLDGWARASLFTISYREKVEKEVTVNQYVDPWGNLIREETASSVRNRYLITQINAMFEFIASVRWNLDDRFSVYGGVHFLYLNAERLSEDRREDMEWRTLGLDLGIEVRF